MPTSRLARARRALLRHALRHPESHEDHPWGEDVVKVRGKIFVFLGMPPDDRMSVTVKLPESNSVALMEPFAEPSGYGLGRAGWVTLTFGPHDQPPIGVLCQWIDESYRAVAPRRLTRQILPGSI